MGRTTELARLQELAWSTLGSLHFWQDQMKRLDQEISEQEVRLVALRTERSNAEFLWLPRTQEILEAIENEIVNDYGAVMAARKAFRDE